jgi:ferredoxin
MKCGTCYDLCPNSAISRTEVRRKPREEKMERIP